MKCWPLDLRHLQRDSGFSAGFGAEGEPAYTLTSALTGGGNIPAVAIILESGDEGLSNLHAGGDEGCRQGQSRRNWDGDGWRSDEYITDWMPSCRSDSREREREREMDSSPNVYPIQTQNAMHNSDAPAGGIGIGAKNGPTQTMRGDGKPPAVGIIDEPKYVVRRITPVEAERLQGFPDGWTDVEFKGKPAPDTARYKALGNSMTVNVMAWIAKRILMVEKGEL